MEEQTQRGPKRIGSGKDKRNYKELMEIEQQRMKEENEAQKKMERRMEEEKEKMREERQQRIRPKLTDEQRKIRNAIYGKSRRHRLRLERAAKDEKFKQKLDACRQRGLESTARRPKHRLPELTAEQKRTRLALQSRDYYHRNLKDESSKTQYKIIKKSLPKSLPSPSEKEGRRRKAKTENR